MLKALTLERYRCFVAPARLELRPLTLLFGRNSVGKSALLRALPLVAASCGEPAPNRTGPLALEHPSAMGARYADVRTHLVAKNELGITLSWGGVAGLEDVAIGLRDMTDMGPTRQVVSRWSARTTAGEELRAELDPETQKLLIDGDASKVLELSGLTPKLAPTMRSYEQGALAACSAVVHNLSLLVDWLGPFREPPPRSRVARVENARLGPLGQGLTEVLADPGATDRFARVRTWVKSIFGAELEIAEESGEVSLAIRVGANRTHILDVGGGVAHVLPVLVRLADVALDRARARILAIEQPEVHLHPEAEVALANVIVDAIAAVREHPQRPSVVLETHSENLLLSLQLAILEKRLAADDVLLLWFDRFDDGSVVPQTIRITESGRPEPPLPPGVFAEDLEIARKILRARSKRHA